MGADGLPPRIFQVQPGTTVAVAARALTVPPVTTQRAVPGIIVRQIGALPHKQRIATELIRRLFPDPK